MAMAHNFYLVGLVLVGLMGVSINGVKYNEIGTIGDKTYVISVNGTATWLGSHYFCSFLEGYTLATIESEAENAFLTSYFEPILGNNTGEFLWTSGSTLGSPEPWLPASLKWSSTGKYFNFGKWQNRQEPILGTAFDYQKCIAVQHTFGPGATPVYGVYWRTRDCTAEFPFLCQKVVSRSH